MRRREVIGLRRAPSGRSGIYTAACGGHPCECGCRDVDFGSKSEKRRREKESREKNEGLNPGDVMEDIAMDWESSLDGHLGNLRKTWRRCRCGLSDWKGPCHWDVKSWEAVQEEENRLGGAASWWVKTKMRMNSANRRKVHWAISQWLGKTSERNRVYEEKTSDAEDDGARRRQKLERERST